VAIAAGKDPLAFRIELLQNPAIQATFAEPDKLAPGQPRPYKVEPRLNPSRLQGVLELVAEKSNWANRKCPPGSGMGLACWYCHLGYFAEVAEVTVDASNQVRVNRVWIAGDIGSQIINPKAAENMVHGGIIDGMSEMNQEITLVNGQVQQTNYHQHTIMRMKQAPPVIEVHFKKTDYSTTGLGEPSLPPILPAIANAIFAATGKRIRSLPMSGSGFKWA
jgi:isoquinoline 1-oxidoreductase beta subunit